MTDTTRPLQMTSSLIKGKAPVNNNNAYELPWYAPLWFRFSRILNASRVEKYRPQVLDDIVGNQETIDRLKVIAKDGNCPHIIISVRIYHSSLVTAQWTAPQGMPGIGKTTSIHCLAHQLLGDAYKEGVLELNASDERFGSCDTCTLLLLLILPHRGIDVVRNKIKAFAQKKVTLPPGRHKIIILDEADRSVPHATPGYVSHLRPRIV